MRKQVISLHIFQTAFPITHPLYFCVYSHSNYTCFCDFSWIKIRKAFVSCLFKRLVCFPSYHVQRVSRGLTTQNQLSKGFVWVNSRPYISRRKGTTASCCMITLSAAISTWANTFVKNDSLVNNCFHQWKASVFILNRKSM